MNLQTNYLGLTLRNPLMPGASPMADNLDVARRLEDAGASAIVLHSLFEEQFDLEEQSWFRDVERFEDSFTEAASFLQEPSDFAHTPEQYLEHLRAVKAAVDVPVIASLNGVTIGGWTTFARYLGEAGADAIELNYYVLPSSATQTARTIESEAIEILREIRRSIGIPVAMKLSPFFTSLPHFTRQAATAGADGFILFNRFYQPDIDIEELDVLPTLQFSDPSELRLRLRWLAILRSTFDGSLAAGGGIHSTEDVIKAIMAGADVVQVVSALLKNGPGHLIELLTGLCRWLEEHEYESLEQLRGSMSLRHCPDPELFERANYMKILQSWKA